MANVSKRTLDFAEIAAAVHKEVGRGTVTEAELALSALKGVHGDRRRRRSSRTGHLPERLGRAPA